MTIPTLIDKQDTSEIVRDKIVSILKAEVISQKALAAAAEPPQDPALYDLNVFTERTNPWEQFLESDPSPIPIVNVWMDNASYEKRSSNDSERQKTEAIYNIDIYGFGISESDGGSGHKPGDREAALEVARAYRLVRNILMAAEYIKLELQGIVWSRWPQSVTFFQPELESNTVAKVHAARLAFAVDFNEFSPQFVPEELELLTTTINRPDDNGKPVEADFDYT